MVQTTMARELEMKPAHGGATPGTRLLTAVIIKSFLEILLVCVVATLAAFAYFNPALRGDVELVSASHIAGWAFDPRIPDRQLEVQLFVDHRFVTAVRAEIARDDLVSAGKIRDRYHGFHFALSDKQFPRGHHRAQIYVVHKAPGDVRTLLPVGKGRRFFEVKE
jgi:hypothetical protein